MQKSLKWFAVLTSIAMLFILIGGALVTKTDSGMGCGRSWPLCNGEWLPTDITPELVIELAHRLVTGAGAIMVFVLSIWSWIKFGHVRETKFLAALSSSFLLIQALFGAAAVIWPQSDFVLALHFGVSLISFSAVLLLTLLLFEVDKKFDAEKLVVDSRMTFHMVGIAVYTYFVIYTGALVRHTNASLVCPDWPLCVNSSFALPNNMYEWIQMGHRAAAGLIFFWILYATILAWKHYRQEKIIFWGWNTALVLVILQVIAGALIIYSRQNLYIALAHALFIACLFGLLSYFLLLITRSKRNSQSKQREKTTVLDQIIQ